MKIHHKQQSRPWSKTVNSRMPGLVILVLVAVGLALYSTRLLAHPATRPQTQTLRFLEPPYYGTGHVNSVYDHEYPMYEHETEPDPAHAFDITTTVKHNNGGRSGTLFYSGHNGIDYDLEYDLVRSAAPGHVLHAGWDNTNHTIGIGLYVHIRHANAYDTLYGHMSVLRVQTDDSITQRDEFQRIIGISGNTGNSTGPHLHFEVEPPNNATSINPYGWKDEEHDDPWEIWSGLASHDLWLNHPSIDNTAVYTSGYPLTAPFITEDKRDYITVDDGDAGFSEDPVNCWTSDATAGWNNDHRYHEVDAAVDCAATWNFPESQRPGKYHVFVHIPPTHATSDAAQYTIQHTASGAQPWEKVSEWAAVNQSVYPNGDHPSSWVYIGTYYFDSNQHGMDYVRLEPQPLDPVGALRIAADAVRFSPVIYRLYLPLTLKQWPPVPATPVLNPIANPDYDPNYDVTWSRVENADSYTLQEADNPVFNNAATRYTGSDTTWSAAGHAYGNFYYRVKAANAWGDGAWSNLQQVSVQPPTPTATATPTVTPTPPPDPCGQQNRLVNGNFEEGETGWEQYSSGGYPVISAGEAHSGTWRVYFGGFENAEEWLRQSFVTPAEMRWIGFNYWRLITTEETMDFSFDTLKIGLQDTPGHYLADPKIISNRNAYRYWQQGAVAFDGLAAWAGRTLWLSLEVDTDNNRDTHFLLDEFTLVYFCGGDPKAVFGDDVTIIHLPPPTPAP